MPEVIGTSEPELVTEGSIVVACSENMLGVEIEDPAGAVEDWVSMIPPDDGISVVVVATKVLESDDELRRADSMAEDAEVAS